MTGRIGNVDRIRWMAVLMAATCAVAATLAVGQSSWSTHFDPTSRTN